MIGKLTILNNWSNTMQDLRTYLYIDIERWVFGAIEKVKQGADWNHAWQETYRQLGGKKDKTMEKVCPRKGAETLYLLGRIKGGRKERKNSSLHEVLHNYSKNGVYAVLALDELELNPDISLKDLWEKIRARVQNDLDEKPAISNQGGPTVAFKLWHLGLTI